MYSNLYLSILRTRAVCLSSLYIYFYALHKYTYIEVLRYIAWHMHSGTDTTLYYYYYYYYYFAHTRLESAVCLRLSLYHFAFDVTYVYNICINNIIFIFALLLRTSAESVV